MSQKLSFRRIASFKTIDNFREHLEHLGLELPTDDAILTGDDSPLLKPMRFGERTIGNRWCVQPMEGWDGTTTGGVTESMTRRWQRFGMSGAKLIWGGEAMAVRPDGSANPNQLIINKTNQAGIASLREALLSAHRKRYGNTDNLLIGFQLTHSGRFSRPKDGKGLNPLIAYRHPLLDRKFNITNDAAVLSDDDIKRLIDDYIAAAGTAYGAGADFVDIKHCHGYLLHEFLGAHTRPGPYGGSLENRTRFLREVVEGIRIQVPKLEIGVRLSTFDFVPFKPHPDHSTATKLGPGIPEDYDDILPYRYGFGVNPENPVTYDLDEPERLLALMESLGIKLVNLTAGSPYYSPHIQRPALFPPSDGYQPPEDPLVGVARQIHVVRALKARFPNLILVGSAYTYLQEYLPHVSQAVVRAGWVDSVGLGRVMLSYPEILADATETGAIDKRRICRTFSDCTTAPRNGLPSGCYPFDDYYKYNEDAKRLKEIKKTF